LKQQYFANVHFPDEVRPVPRIGIRFFSEKISRAVEILAIDCLLVLDCIFPETLWSPWCIDVAADPMNINECTKLCKESQAIVVSSSYRLTPENRLPAAYDDSFNALKWLQKQVNTVMHTQSSSLYRS
jgi:hypothetical protein